MFVCMSTLILEILRAMGTEFDDKIYIGLINALKSICMSF